MDVRCLVDPYHTRVQRWFYHLRLNQSFTLQLQPEKIHMINKQGNTTYAHNGYRSATSDILSIFQQYLQFGSANEMYMQRMECEQISVKFVTGLQSPVNTSIIWRTFANLNKINIYYLSIKFSFCTRVHSVNPIKQKHKGIKR